jgi:uncharacterized RDD family membrane protein YckC
VQGFLRVLTPEKTVVSYEIAGIASRAAAFIVDLFIIGAIIQAIALLVTIGGFAIGFDVAQSITTFLTILLFFVYFGAQEAFFRGQTIGKRALGLRVIMADGTPITRSAALFRVLMMPGDLLPAIPLVALTCMFFNERSQRFADLAAGTVVVRQPKVRGTFTPSPHRAGVHHFEHMIPNVDDISKDEYWALKKLCDRFPDLPPETQIESVNSIWNPFATRHRIEADNEIHPIYIAEAVVMKYGRVNNLI